MTEQTNLAIKVIKVGITFYTVHVPRSRCVAVGPPQAPLQIFVNSGSTQLLLTVTYTVCSVHDSRLGCFS